MKIKCLSSGSKGNSYAIDDGNSVLFLEAGISAKRILTGYNRLLSRVCGCLVTHEHMDHAKGLLDISSRGIDIYASAGTLETFKRNARCPYRLNTVKAGNQFELGTWIILPWEAQHDAAEPLGFLIYSTVTKERLLFATDTYYIPNTFRNLDYIMIEANYSPEILQENISKGKVDKGQENRLLQSHFSIENVKDFLNHNDMQTVKRIYLIHVSDRNGDKDDFKKQIQRHTGVPVTVL